MDFPRAGSAEKSQLPCSAGLRAADFTITRDSESHHAPLSGISTAGYAAAAAGMGNAPWDPSVLSQVTARASGRCGGQVQVPAATLPARRCPHGGVGSGSTFAALSEDVALNT